MRLDRYLCESLGLTRSQAQQVVRKGRVMIGDAVVKKIATQVDEAQLVLVDEKPVPPPPTAPRYLMLNKPAGYVSATTDSEHPTVLDLLDEPMLHKLHPVGRLDIDTTGLLLITDDGKWSHRITSPRHHCSKVYLAELADELIEDAEQRFAEGILLRSEKTPTAPAVLERLSPFMACVTLTEGRYHQIKRMFAALGNRVVELQRIQIGGLKLDGQLAEGAYRPLTDAERRAVEFGDV